MAYWRKHMTRSPFTKKYYGNAFQVTHENLSPIIR